MSPSQQPLNQGGHATSQIGDAYIPAIKAGNLEIMGKTD